MIKIYTVTRPGNTHHPRATTDLLDSTLRKGCRIGEALVVEDVIEIDSRNTHADSAKGNTLQTTGIYILTQIDATYLVVTTSTTIVQISTDLCGINADVKFLLEVLVIYVNILQVKSITSEDPTPAEVRTDL